VQRTALAEHALISTDDQSVTFRYRDSRDGQRKTMTLPGEEFLRRLLQHVLPKGFHRVRAFGLLHPEHRSALFQLQLLLAPRAAATATADDMPLTVARTRRCPTCGAAALRLVCRLTAAECLALEPALAPKPPLARAPPLAPSRRSARLASLACSPSRGSCVTSMCDRRTWLIMAW
jgi:hypothetical protein